MQIHIPDPAYTSSERAQAGFRLALRIAFGFVALLWLIQLLDWGFDLDLARFGMRPREWSGLVGVLLAPLLHGGFAHLAANSAPLVVLITAMLHLYPNSAVRAFPAIYLGAGLAVWLLGRDAIHVGASGLVYGLVAHVFMAGVIRHDRRAIAASLLVSFLYGSLVWGVLPIQPGVSWETHLAGAVIGILSAIALRRLDIPPSHRYGWEEDEEDGRRE